MKLSDIWVVSGPDGRWGIRLDVDPVPFHTFATFEEARTAGRSVAVTCHRTLVVFDGEGLIKGREQYLTDPAREVA